LKPRQQEHEVGLRRLGSRYFDKPSYRTPWRGSAIQSATVSRQVL